MSNIVFWTSRTEEDFTVGTHFCPQKTQEETLDFLGVGFLDLGLGFRVLGSGKNVGRNLLH